MFSASKTTDGTRNEGVGDTPEEILQEGLMDTGLTGMYSDIRDDSLRSRYTDRHTGRAAGGSDWRSVPDLDQEENMWGVGIRRTSPVVILLDS